MRERIRKQVEEVLQSYESEPSHVRQVAHLADQIFFDLQSWHGLGPEHREWLQVAALLHDIGWSQTSTGAGHHKHSARLIRAYRWQIFSPEVVSLLALIARYHRKALPSAEHAEYVALTTEGQRIVSILGGVLRIADALDRSHASMVARVSTEVGKEQIHLKIFSLRPCLSELTAVTKKKDLLESISGRVVVANIDRSTPLSVAPVVS